MPMGPIYANLGYLDQSISQIMAGTEGPVKNMARRTTAFFSLLAMLGLYNP